MLDTETRRRIDTARDILVGKVPDPKSQVEQITIALIYKFMDDMDLQAEELGGKRTFFTGEFGRYRWSKLMRSGLGGHEMLNVYAEAIARMPENPGIPPLFRDIFKNAFLPYRDPETLRAFLKIIDEFEYDHSERLGDAFEYLLSVLGSQGQAGQFRTPRHIIDFIVAIVDPKKDETILDPACGTAGFLISAYKHILKANSTPEAIESNGRRNGEAALHTSKIPKATGDLLSPDERKRLADNLSGYDISPDMVRLSLVNMYLHGFTDPHIHEYDTLTSDDRWNEYADVILANPPFMSPKGGIRPHNRFSVQSKRSEVLFVDYMAEHLTPAGRAGFIVPEGIIFQSQNAYKQLRQMLVDSYLVAVISLPAGVFQPYSGVKTSILILDRTIAKKSETIGFFKVENDGFGLGAQRRPIDKNDLPQVQEEVAQYLQRLRAGESVAPDDFKPALGLVVDKQKIAENAEYNLSGERYRETLARTSTFPFVPLGEVCDLARGVTYKKDHEVEENGHKVLRANNIDKDTGSLNLHEIKRISESVELSDDKKLRKGDVFICLASGSKDHIGKVAFIDRDTDFYFGGFMGAVRARNGMLEPAYLFHQLRHKYFNDFLREQIAGANINNLGSKLLYRFEIPLPPLEVQKEIVAEIEGYQKVIDGARAVIDNYKPRIPINPDWPMVELREVADILRGITYAKSDQLERPATDSLAVATTKAAQHDGIVVDDLYYIPRAKLKDDSKLLRRGDILISTANSLHLLGRTTHVRHDPEWPTSFGAFMSVVRPREKVLDVFLLGCLRSDRAVEFYQRFAKTTTNISNLNTSELARMQIPLPPLETQQQIVAEIEDEQRLVESNRELIERMEKKIERTIARIWGEPEDADSTESERPAPEG